VDPRDRRAALTGYERSPSPSCAPSAASRAPAAFVQAATSEEAGRYLFTIGGCNDCHTVGWAESGGKLPETEWALGNPVGYRGPWGTTYAENLRLSATENTEKQWIEMFRRSAGPPPMPWQNYRDMSQSDLVALQRFLASLGARGMHAPAPLLPGQEPSTRYIDLTPKGPGR
jgi:hypothetical protein